MKIRKATLKDLDECVNVCKTPELRLGTGRYPDKKYLKEFLGSFFLVAEENNKIVGLLVGEKSKGKWVALNILGISKRHRGKGVGKLLINEFKKISKRLGFKYIYLIAPKWNKNTIKFYEKDGFIRRDDYIYFYKWI